MLWSNNEFVTAARDAIRKQLLGDDPNRSISEISTEDSRDVSITHNDVTYKLTFVGLIASLKNSGIEGINSLSEARDFLSGNKSRMVLPSALWSDDKFVDAVRDAIRQQLLDGNPDRSISELSTNDRREVAITHNDVTYKLAFKGILRSICSGIEGITSPPEARDFLSGNKSRARLSPALWSNDKFVDAVRDAIRRQLLDGNPDRSISELSVGDNREVPVTYNDVTYKLTFHGILQSPVTFGIKGITSTTEARDFLSGNKSRMVLQSTLWSDDKFVDAARDAIRQQLLDGNPDRSISELSVGDCRNVSIPHNGVTYKPTFEGILRSICSGIADITTATEAKDFLSGNKSRMVLPPALWSNDKFVDAVRDAIRRQLLDGNQDRSISELSVGDNREVSITHNYVTYKLTFVGILASLKRSGIEGITTPTEARDFLSGNKSRMVLPSALWSDDKFVAAVRDAIRQQLLDGNPDRSISELSVGDNREVSITHNYVTYTITFPGILVSLKSSGMPGITHRAEAKDFLSGDKSRRFLTPALWSNDKFVDAAREAIRQQLLGADPNKSISEISTEDNTEVPIIYNCITYKPTFMGILQSLKRSGIDGITTATEARDFLSGNKSRMVLPSALWSDDKFVDAVRDAIRQQLLDGNPDRSISELSTNDHREVSITHNYVTYKLTFVRLITSLRNSGIEGITTPTEARDFLSGNKSRMFLPSELWSNDEFVDAAREAIRQQLLGGDPNRSISEISTNDHTEVAITYNDVTYKPAFTNILRCLCSEVEGLTSFLDARDFLSGNKSRMLLPPALWSDDKFVDAARDAIRQQLLDGNPDRSISELSVGDRREVSITHSDLTYKLTFYGITRSLKSSGIKGITSHVEARDFLELSSYGMTREEALRNIHSGELEGLREDKELEIAEKMNLGNVIALLGEHPIQMKKFLLLSNPNLTEGASDRLVLTSFHALNRTGGDRESEYLKFSISLKGPSMQTVIPVVTSGKTLTVKGTADAATHVYIAGPFGRRIRVVNGEFQATIPLTLGKHNELRLFAINTDDKTRSEVRTSTIRQSSEASDAERLLEAVRQMGSDALARLKTDAGAFDLLVDVLEETLIKRFVYSFESAESSVADLIKREDSEVVRRGLEQVLGTFRLIRSEPYPALAEGEELLFYQKYAIHKIRKAVRRADRSKGVILSLEAGLGKTLTTLAALQSLQRAGLIVTPNSVASTWDEQRSRFLPHERLTLLHGLPRDARKAAIRQEVLSRTRRGGERSSMLTNQEFLRDAEDEERFELLNSALGQDGILVVDEAHWLTNTDTNQSKGLGRLTPDFVIIVTATPYPNISKYRAMFNYLLPDDERFESESSFAKAFDRSDPASYRALFALADPLVVRFRKEEVLDEYDPAIPLAEQHGRLPIKTRMPVTEFELTDAQARSVLDMFLNWRGWSEKYGHYLAGDREVWEGNQLIKKHALLQSMNNPSYVGSDEQSAKHNAVVQAVEENVRDGRKTVIYVRYLKEAEAYEQLLRTHKPAILTGTISDQGYLKDGAGNPKLFCYDKEKGFAMDKNGYPIEDPTGSPMMAIDFERLTFMQAPERKVMICTYDTGGVGITLNAGKTIIFADAPNTYTEYYQALNRLDRIDTPNTKTHYDIRIHKISCRYPTPFLEEMRKTHVRKTEQGYAIVPKAEVTAQDATAYDTFFEQGTYDSFMYRRIGVQERMFNLLVDGIASDEDINLPRFTGIDTNGKDNDDDLQATKRG